LKVLPHLSIDHAKVRDVDSDTLKEYENRIAALEKEKIDYKELLNNPEFLKDLLELMKGKQTF